MVVLLKKSSWTTDSRCTQILLYVTAVVVKFLTVVAGGLRAMCLSGECGQECCNERIQIEDVVETEIAVVTFCRVVVVVK